MKILLLMAYLNMCSLVTIGNVQLKNINSVTIEESVTELSDKATIVIPRNYQEFSGKKVLDYIKAGDPVNIKLGYDGNPEDEFNGFVKQIGADIPLEIECDELYPLRQNNFIKSYKVATLKQVLTDVLPGYTIECPSADLGKFQIDNASSYQVLSKLKEEYGLFTKIVGKLIHVGFAFDWSPSFTQKHVYKVGENVKKNDLKFKRKEDFNTRVKIVVKVPNGKDITVEKGSKDADAAVTTINFPAKSKAEAEKIAEARLKKSVYDGFTGDITGFGFPRTHAGDSLQIIDPKYPELEDTYLVEKVAISYDESGFERKNTLSFKVS